MSKQSKNKHVAVQHVKCDIPDLYSLDKPVDLKHISDEKFQEFFTQLEKSFKEYKKGIQENNTVNKSLLDHMQSLIDQEITHLPKGKTPEEEKITRIINLFKIRLCSAQLYWFYGVDRSVSQETFHILFKMVKQIDRYLNLKKFSTPHSEELYWYKSSFLWLFYSLAYKNVGNYPQPNLFNTILFIPALDIFASLLEAFNNITVIQHKKVLFLWMRECYGLLPGYPDLALFKKTLGADLTDFPEVAELQSDHFYGQCVQNYLDTHRKQTPYFDCTKIVVSNRISGILGPFELKYIEKLEQEVSLRLNDQLLQSFAAHILPPGRPRFKFLMSYAISTELKESISNGIIAYLHQDGFCDSDGSIHDDVYTNSSRLEELINKGYDHCNRNLENHHLPSISKEFFAQTIKDQKSTYDQLMRMRERLAGLTNDTQSLLLFIKCLEILELKEPTFPGLHQLEEKNRINSIRRIIGTCLQISKRAEEIAQWTDITKCSQGWFDLADGIVDHLHTQQQDIIICSGPPIKYNSDQCTHAFYVLLKLLPMDPLQKSARFFIKDGEWQFHRVDIADNQVNLSDLMSPAKFYKLLADCKPSETLTDQFSEWILNNQYPELVPKDILVKNKRILFPSFLKEYKKIEKEISQLEQNQKSYSKPPNRIVQTLKKNNEQLSSYKEALQSLCKSQKIYRIYVNLLQQNKIKLHINDLVRLTTFQNRPSFIWVLQNDRLVPTQNNHNLPIDEVKRGLHLLTMGDPYSFKILSICDKFLYDQVEIAITNGGAGSLERHPFSRNNFPKEKQCRHRHYVGFAPLDLTEQNKILLKEYIWLLIATPYLKVEKCSKGNKEHQFYNDALDNIYLSKENCSGFYPRATAIKKGPINLLQRKIFEKTFLIQITGNCTLHNLKNMLKFYYDMKSFDYLALEASLLAGLDHLISVLLSSEPTDQQLAQNIGYHPCLEGKDSALSQPSSLPLSDLMQVAPSQVKRKKSESEQELSLEEGASQRNLNSKRFNDFIRLPLLQAAAEEKPVSPPPPDEGDAKVAFPKKEDKNSPQEQKSILPGALFHKPDHKQALKWMSKGIRLYKKGDYDGALGFYQKALAHWNNSRCFKCIRSCHYRIGCCHLKKHEYATAEKHLKKAVEFNNKVQQKDQSTKYANCLAQCQEKISTTQAMAISALLLAH